MKILSFDNYISEKKSIRPLTVKQIKNIGLYDSPDMLNPVDISYHNASTPGNIVITKRDAEYVLWISVDNTTMIHIGINRADVNNALITLSKSLIRKISWNPTEVWEEQFPQTRIYRSDFDEVIGIYEADIDLSKITDVDSFIKLYENISEQYKNEYPNKILIKI